MSPEEIAVRMTRRSALSGLRGDHDLSGLPRPSPPLKPAAVLVGIVVRAEAPGIILTQRTAHLADHAGQISFPGGRIEPEDKDPEAAALREAQEEIGLDPRRVRLLGRLDCYETGTGYSVTPVVALVRPPFELRPDPYEVADIFEVPLHFVLDRRNHERRSREWQGKTRHFYVLPYQNRYIWGATAGMLVNLVDVLAAEGLT
ncbi:MAG: CoA pyrophosphatase [Alphaproteobacteria bacterium]|nr:MAG: CoA pyrophosphatase [Alphaproteobacteria bacterium]